MNQIGCLSLLVLAMVVERAEGDNPLPPCFESPTKRASLALIDDTAVFSQIQIELSQPEGPSVAYLLKMDADDVANRIMQLLARDNANQGSIMLSSHGKTLTVTGDLPAQKRVLEKIVLIENPLPMTNSNSIVDIIRAAQGSVRSKQ